MENLGIMSCHELDSRDDDLHDKYRWGITLDMGGRQLIIVVEEYHGYELISVESLDFQEREAVQILAVVTRGKDIQSRKPQGSSTSPEFTKAVKKKTLNVPDTFSLVKSASNLSEITFAEGREKFQSVRVEL